MAFFNKNTENARLALAKDISDGRVKLNSNIIKSLLFDYFRFQRSFLGVLVSLILMGMRCFL